MFQMGLRSQEDTGPLSDYSDDLKEAISSTSEINDDDGSNSAVRHSGADIFGDQSEEKVRMQLPLDWIEERFRVDRRKLEEMILANTDRNSGWGGSCFENGEIFFQNVMDQTGCMVTWPSKLKIGAKSKKDPHVKVCGLQENVKKAKEIILDKLDARSTRVTLKMDVPHTEHSHVIGKGGSTIKKVMEETGCHIHFPDSNRSGSTEKSNQVSIAGEPAGVESARRKIRALLPIVLTFDLPKTGVVRPNPDINSPTIQRIIQTYNISIQFRARPRGQPTAVPVRGTQQNVTGLKDGITCLMQHLTGQIGATLPVSCSLDVAPQHQQVLTKAMRIIQQKTGARITIQQPDPNNIMKTRSPSPVTITGTVDAVVIARHQLIEYLPLVLMCDMKENSNPDGMVIQNIMERNDIFVSIRPKPKQANKSVIIKSIEGNVQRMFDGRKDLLGLKTSGLEHITFLPSLSNMTNKAPMVTVGHSIGHAVGHSVGHSVGHTVGHNREQTFFNTKTDDIMSRGSGSNYGYHSSEEHDKFNQVTPIQRPSPRDSPGSSTSGHYSDSMGGSDIRKPSNSPTSSIEALEQRLSALTTNTYDQQKALWESKNNLGATLNTNQFANHLQHSFTSNEYARLGQMALQAMARPVLGPEIQTPTNAWAGLGFSRSMNSADMARTSLASRPIAAGGNLTPTYEESIYSTWRDSRNTINQVEQVQSQVQPASCGMASFKQEKQNQSLTQCVDLPEVFEYLGLSKYTDVFVQQEVDLQTFLSLTDGDLKELGITTFGPRRKMLLAIQELNKNGDSILQGIVQNRSRQTIMSRAVLASSGRW